MLGIRMEKKTRKANFKLGLKLVAKVSRVTIRKSINIPLQLQTTCTCTCRPIMLAHHEGHYVTLSGTRRFEFQLHTGISAKFEYVNHNTYITPAKVNVMLVSRSCRCLVQGHIGVSCNVMECRPRSHGYLVQGHEMSSKGKSISHRTKISCQTSFKIKLASHVKSRRLIRGGTIHDTSGELRRRRRIVGGRSKAVLLASSPRSPWVPELGRKQAKRS